MNSDIYNENYPYTFDKLYIVYIIFYKQIILINIHNNY